MNHTLFRKLNYRNILLDEDTKGQTVGVVRKDLSLKYIPWGGFIQRETAKLNHQAKPVLLAISRVDGNDLDPGEYVQGCLIGPCVYAVIDSSVAVVKKNSR